MGFLSGRVSFERFKVGGRDLHQFDQRHLEMLERHAIGKAGALTADGTEVGFAAGDHVLDVDFRLEKNILGDCLHAAIRIDTNKVPSDLFKAYMQIELKALSADNPSGYPTKKQKLQAKEAAEARAEQEAKDGRFRRRKFFSFLWDAKHEVIYFANSGQTTLERFVSLFKETFGRQLERLTTSKIAFEQAQTKGLARAYEDLSPAVFGGPKKKYNVAWVADQFGSRDFLGNEFIVWLWWILESQTDTISLSDGSAVTCMLNRTLTLECPLNEMGKETLSSEVPTKLPESRQALLGGKLPRKSGISLTRHDETFHLTLQAESFAVSGANFPKIETPESESEAFDRIEQVRHLAETLDLLFEAFLIRRLANGWSNELGKLRAWLHDGELG